MIKYLLHKEIDKVKWDECVAQSTSPLIYGLAFYLDAMSPNWDALVLDDYEAVMPLTWRKKYGIKYLYQPAFSQQLGIFQKKDLTNLTLEFLGEAQAHFKFAEIALHYNSETPVIPGITYTAKTNYIKFPGPTYVLQNEKNIVIKNYTSAVNKGLTIAATENFEKIIALSRGLYGKTILGLTPRDYRNFTQVCRHCRERQMLVAKNILNEKKEIIGGCVILTYKERFYNLISVINAEGRKKSGNYLLMASLFREITGANTIFDFEGSDLHGIAEFYQKFSPVNQPYTFVKFNNFNPLLRIFKK